MTRFAYYWALVTASEIIELRGLPNVIRLKITDHDFYKLSLIRNTGAVVFNGYDEVPVAGLVISACGGIGTFYNLVPELFVEVHSLARAGRWDEARSGKARIDELIKTILRWSGIDCGTCFEPRRPRWAASPLPLKGNLLVAWSIRSADLGPDRARLLGAGQRCLRLQLGKVKTCSS